MATKRQSSKQTSRGTAALLESLAELEGAVRKGMSITDIKKRFPGHVRVVAPKPGKYTAAAVKTLRDRIGVSQADFGNLLGVSRILVQSWERGVREPSALACRLLDTIAMDPVTWLANLRPVARPPSRRAS